MSTVETGENSANIGLADVIRTRRRNRWIGSVSVHRVLSGDFRPPTPYNRRAHDISEYDYYDNEVLYGNLSVRTGMQTAEIVPVPQIEFSIRDLVDGSILSVASLETP